MTLEQNILELRIPENINAPWLTVDYIEKNGWYPVCDERLRDYPKSRQYENSPFGRVPWKSRSEFRPGDIIIFNEYEEEVVNDHYETDRFLTISKEDIKEYKRGARDLLPVGIVVHPSNT